MGLCSGAVKAVIRVFMTRTASVALAGSAYASKRGLDKSSPSVYTVLSGLAFTQVDSSLRGYQSGRRCNQGSAQAYSCSGEKKGLWPINQPLTPASPLLTQVN